MKDAEGEVDETVAAEADAEIVDGEAAQAQVEEEAQPEIGSAEYRDRLPEIAWINDWDQLNELDADLASRTPKSLWPQGDEEASVLSTVCVSTLTCRTLVDSSSLCSRRPETPRTKEWPLV